MSPLAPLSGASAFTAWQADPAGIAVVVLLGGWYLMMVRRVTAAGHRWPLRRTLIFFVLGLGTVLIATAGGIGVYSRQLLWIYVVRVVLLLLIAPTFLAFGRPLSLLRLDSARAAGRVHSVLERLSNPLIGPALVPVCTGLVLFTGVLTASLRSTSVADVVAVGLLLAGVVFALPLAGEGVTPVSLAIAFAVLVGFVELLADAIPGFAMRMRNSLITPWFAGLHRGWGPTPLNDQHLGGSILWAVAELVDLPFLALMVVQWIRVDAREAAEQDRRLDELERARASTATDADVATAATSVPLDKPWWEVDPSVFGTRGRQFRR